MAGEPAPGSPTNNNNGGTSRVEAGPDTSVAQKRQRRPSVRLGDIGDKPSNYARPIRSKPSSSLKTRPLTNLVNSNTHNDSSSAAPATSESRRPRTNLLIDPHDDPDRDKDTDVVAAHNDIDFEQEHEEEEEEEEEQEEDRERDIEGEAEERSHDNSGGGSHKRSRCGVRVTELDAGVRKWLLELGMGRYAPVFEIHEVDEEVLPLLTLEDLKDMGINAVGSRRKLYAAILNLRKTAFS